MKHATQVDIVRRLLRHIQDGSTDRGDRETTYRVNDYLDERRFDLEMAAVFRRQPMIIAHSSRLTRSGDYITESVLGVPVVVLRGDGGRLRAFVNVCRHRAARLLNQGCGSGLRAIVCPYHAWSYDLTGRLTTIPDETGSFPAIGRDGYDLVPLPVAERHGFVWLGLTPGAGLDLPEFLGPLDDELASLKFDSFTFYAGEARSWRFNWKTGVEAFLENYHFATLHKRSTSRIFFNNVTVLDTLGRHIRAVAPKLSLPALRDLPERDWDLRPHATLLYVLFPGTCLFVEKLHASVVRMIPEGPAATRVRIDHVVGRDGLAYREHWNRNIELFTSAVLEDLDMCESMTAGFAALPDRRIVFGRNEAGCVAFRNMVDGAVAADQPDRAGSGRAATGPGLRVAAAVEGGLHR